MSPSDGSETLRPRARLRRRADYLTVQSRGRRVSGDSYLLLVHRRPEVPDIQPRLGVTVSRKVGNAVTRNRVKRWVRESYRRLGARVPPATDVVVVARPKAASAGYAETQAELTFLFETLSGRRAR